MYAKDKNSVYYTYKRVEGADLETFHIVEHVPLLFSSFGEDKNRAYWDGEIFPKQDLAFLKRGKLPISAKGLGENYYLYQEAIYYLSPPGGGEPQYLTRVRANPLSESSTVYADAATFRALKNGYARDKDNVYLREYLLVHDPVQSFVLLEYPYSKDEHKVYYENEVIAGANPRSFSVIPNSRYSKDEDAVYYPNSPVRKIDADPSAFKLIPGGDGAYGSDGKSIYFVGKKIEKVDLESFRVLGIGLNTDVGYGEPMFYSYARDKDNVFCEGGILPGADVKTFVLKGKNGMPQDKFHRYSWCEAVE